MKLCNIVKKHWKNRLITQQACASNRDRLTSWVVLASSQPRLIAEASITTFHRTQIALDTRHTLTYRNTQNAREQHPECSRVISAFPAKHWLIHVTAIYIYIYIYIYIQGRIHIGYFKRTPKPTLAPLEARQKASTHGWTNTESVLSGLSRSFCTTPLSRCRVMMASEDGRRRCRWPCSPTSPHGATTSGSAQEHWWQYQLRI